MKIDAWKTMLPLTAAGLLLAGCTESTETQNAAGSAHGEHDGHDHEGEHHHGPETLAEAVKSITGLRNTIRDAFAKNDADAAHDPLHDVGHVLEAFEELAKKEQVSAENTAVIKSSVEKLFTAFGDVDKTMHGQEGKSYNEVSAEVDAAITALTAACGVAADAAAAPAGDQPAGGVKSDPAAPAAEETVPPADTDNAAEAKAPPAEN